MSAHPENIKLEITHDLPASVEAAAHRFATSCSIAGVSGLVKLLITDGKVRLISLDQEPFRGDFAIFNGKLYKLVGKPDEDGKEQGR